MTAEAPVAMRPLQSNYHVRLLEAEEKSEGGIYLPDSLKENWTTGEVIAAGPGYAIPDSAHHSTMWAEPGDDVLFFQHDYRLMAGRQGCVRDEDVIGLCRDGALIPHNDWVQVELLEREEFWGESRLVLPDSMRRRKNVARIVRFGPGRLRLSGPYYGTRKSVPGIMGITTDQALNCLVHWGEDAEAYELGRGAVEWIFVRAGDLLMTQEETHG